MSSLNLNELMTHHSLTTQSKNSLKLLRLKAKIRAFDSHVASLKVKQVGPLGVKSPLHQQSQDWKDFLAGRALPTHRKARPHEPLVRSYLDEQVPREGTTETT